MTQKVMISESAFRAAWDAVEATVSIPGVSIDTDDAPLSVRRDLLWSIRRDDIAAAWVAFDKGGGLGFTDNPAMRDPAARREFFPYEMIALIMRAEAEVEMLEESPVVGLPN
jgi:hypothetical protein